VEEHYQNILLSNTGVSGAVTGPQQKGEADLRVARACE